MSTLSNTAWGLLPENVVQTLRIKYWQSPRKLKGLLSGGQLFPLVVPLKPPRGNAATQDINHFQNFVSSWKNFSQNSIKGSGQEISDSTSKGCEVIWEKRNFRSLAEQDIPTHLTITDIGSLACLLGSDEERQLQQWLFKVRYIFEQLAWQSSSRQLNGHQDSFYVGRSFLTDSDQNLF